MTNEKKTKQNKNKLRRENVSVGNAEQTHRCLCSCIFYLPEVISSLSVFSKRVDNFYQTINHQWQNTRLFLYFFLWCEAIYNDSHPSRIYVIKMCFPYAKSSGWRLSANYQKVHFVYRISFYPSLFTPEINEFSILTCVTKDAL